MSADCPQNTFTGLHVPFSGTTPQCRLCGAPLDGGTMRAAGVALAEHHAPGSWTQAAERALTALAISGDDFTSEDVIEAAGLPRGEVGLNRNNAVGALILRASQMGQIVKAGRRIPSRRPRSHGAQLEVWRGR